MMKPATFFFALTLILLFTKPSLSSRAIVDDTVVYDGLGNPLQKNASYTIGPPVWGPLGGRVILGSPNENNGTCSADVLQFPVSSVSPAGTPFTFTPVDPNEDVIKLGKPVAIESPTENPCEEGSTVWKVTSNDASGIITTGGIINTANSCLVITRPRSPLFPYSYEFQYCPSMCGVGFRICYPIGTEVGNDHQIHLSPKGSRPFELVFIKASEPALISQVI